MAREASDAMNNKIVKGLAAISIADAEKIGTVTRAYFDPKKMEIVGFVISPGHGLMEAEKTSLVDVSDVHSLGPDALMVDDKTSFHGDDTGNRFDHLVDLDTLAKHKVVTEGGTFVGQVASIDFDEKTFRLTRVEASPGFFKSNKHVTLGQITTIGNDLIIVADEVVAADPAVATEPDAAEAHRFDRVVEEPDPVASPVPSSSTI